MVSKQLRYFIFAIMATIATDAFAYLDPVTGSLILQGVVSAVVAVLAGIKSIRKKIFEFFSTKEKEKDDSK